MSLGQIARTWDVCARAVISEHAQQSGGGTFSSKYGTWENCLSAAWSFIFARVLGINLDTQNLYRLLLLLLPRWPLSRSISSWKIRLMLADMFIKENKHMNRAPALYTSWHPLKHFLLWLLAVVRSCSAITSRLQRSRSGTLLLCMIF